MAQPSSRTRNGQRDALEEGRDVRHERDGDAAVEADLAFVDVAGEGVGEDVVAQPRRVVLVARGRARAAVACTGGGDIIASRRGEEAALLPSVAAAAAAPEAPAAEAAVTAPLGAYLRCRRCAACRLRPRRELLHRWGCCTGAAAAATPLRGSARGRRASERSPQAPTRSECLRLAHLASPWHSSPGLRCVARSADAGKGEGGGSRAPSSPREPRRRYLECSAAARPLGQPVGPGAPRGLEAHVGGEVDEEGHGRPCGCVGRLERRHVLRGQAVGQREDPDVDRGRGTGAEQRSRGGGGGEDCRLPRPPPPP